MQEPPYKPNETRSLYEPYNSNDAGSVYEEEELKTPRTMSADVWIGFAMIAVGLIVTLGSYSAASSGSGGGNYFITLGLFIFGVIRVVRGLGSRDR